MLRRSVRLAIVVVVITSYLLVLCGSGSAAAPTVKLVVDPAITHLYVGTESISLTAEATGSEVTFIWELQGPGKIKGKGAEISYIVPETIKGTSTQATIIVTVTDDAGQETTETVTFDILAKEESLKPAKKGMSTKVILGAGAAALLGGGIALAVSGSDDGGDDNGPFAGTWKREWVDQFDSGTPAYYTGTLNLEQKKRETSVTGNHVVILTDHRCCAASFTTLISGRAYDQTAVSLSWGPGRGRCEGSGGCWIETWTDGGTYEFWLVDDGRKLVRGGVEYIRQ